MQLGAGRDLRCVYKKLVVSEDFSPVYKGRWYHLWDAMLGLMVAALSSLLSIMECAEIVSL